jgi:RNA-directed DNA polymerase
MNGKHYINNWQDIQWKTVEKYVLSLQFRIYKAATNQETEKMYKSQKTLIFSNYAKFLAVRKVTLDNTNKRIPGVDKKIITTHEERFQLANQLKLDGKSLLIRRIYIAKPTGNKRALGIPTIKDQAKQVLANLALSPQWESRFEANGYGFRPRKYVHDPMESVFLGIYNKPKWVLDVDISKCFDKINHDYLIRKCNTFPKMQRQLKSWLKAGILDDGQFRTRDNLTKPSKVISILLSNIALDGLIKKIDSYIATLPGSRPKNRQSLTFVRYVDNFILMYPKKKIIEKLKEVTEDFLKEISLELNVTKTRILHALDHYNDIPPGFSFLGFNIIQKPRWNRIRKTFYKQQSKQNLMTFRKPSIIKSVKVHKKNIRDTIRKYKGTKQQLLIYKLNVIIRQWANSKRTQIASKVFQKLDKYTFEHLWKWAKKRHQKMSRYKLKEKYWHKSGNRNWIFGIQKDEKISFQLLQHSYIKFQRHLIPNTKAKLIKENL